MKILIIKFSPNSYCFVSLSVKYFHLHRVPKHNQPALFPHAEEPSFTCTYKKR